MSKFGWQLTMLDNYLMVALVAVLGYIQVVDQQCFLKEIIVLVRCRLEQRWCTYDFDEQTQIRDDLECWEIAAGVGFFLLPCYKCEWLCMP